TINERRSQVTARKTYLNKENRTCQQKKTAETLIERKTKTKTKKFLAMIHRSSWAEVAPRTFGYREPFHRGCYKRFQIQIRNMRFLTSTCSILKTTTTVTT